ncbi:Universal stress protein family protein [Prosthecobacter debontii]|uniref:Universal stress protein n=1 Tax=Prosthecobacter debontii TaxID=48467 RepID=A0A1T4YA63_9BACT|nr:universal stress protein [Prosthecobacter debontii]SKA98165.1 Universal stress protein family protein [Prosthecobacter debontii]
MKPTSTLTLWKKVLVPTDFSDWSQAAVHKAAQLHRDAQTEVILLHVTEPSYEGLRIHTQDLHEKIREEAETALKDLAAQTFSGTEGLTLRIIEGRPADAICKAAQEEKAEAIFISAHGHSALKHMLLGSVTEKVVRQAACDVLVIR